MKRRSGSSERPRYGAGDVGAFRLLFTVGALLLFWAPPASAKIPQRWIVTFVVHDEGTPIDGEHDLVVRLLDRTVRGSVLVERHLEDVAFQQGVATIDLSVTGLAALPDDNPRYLSVTVDGQEALPRIPVASVPAAAVVLEAELVENTDGIWVSERSVVDDEGRWVGPPVSLERTELGTGPFAQAMERMSQIGERAENAGVTVGDQRIRAASLAERGGVVDSRSAVIVRDAASLAELFDGVERRVDGVAFVGLDLHIRSGLASSYHAGTLESVGVPNGLGNLIIGYDEPDERGSDAPRGSHNVVVGPGHDYAGFGALFVGRGGASGDDSAGALVVGIRGRVEGFYGASLGGEWNLVSADGAVAVAGRASTAEGQDAASVGGLRAAAGGVGSVAIGGQDAGTSGDASLNLASSSGDAGGTASVALGGSECRTSGIATLCLGGNGNVAGGAYTVVAGGAANQAEGELCVASGGRNNRANGFHSVGACVFGGGGERVEDGNRAAGNGSVIIGGAGANTEDDRATGLGGRRGQPLGREALVLGGQDGYGEDDVGTVIGGRGLEAVGPFALAVGGEGSSAGGVDSLLVGGGFNGVCAESGVVVGNTSSGPRGTARVCFDATTEGCVSVEEATCVE